MTDYTRLAAAGLIMLAMLIAGCGGDDPISPTAPSATLTAGAAPPGETAPTVSALGETGALETGKTIGVDAEDAATSAAVSGVHTTINLSGIAWQRNAYNNKLIPDDATDDEGNGSAAAMAADARVQLVHIWVRGNGTGLAVVDSHEDLAGEMLDLGGGIQYALTYRRGENPARFVTNLSADDVRSIEDRSGGEEPKTAEGKGDDDDKGGGGKGGRADPACMLTLVTTDDITVPAGGNDTSRTAEIRFTTNGFCAMSATIVSGTLDIGRHFRSSASWISGIRLARGAQAGLGYTYTATFRATVYDGAVVRDGEVWVTADGSGSAGGVGTSDRVTVQQARIEHAPTITALTCAQRDGSAIKDCAGGINPLGQSPKFTATAADPNTADTLTYTWEKTGGRWHNAPQTGPTGNVAYWVQPSGGQSGRYTITVTVSDGVASTNDATTSMTIEVPSCTILVDGNSHVNPADGQSGFLAAGGTGRLSFRKGDHEACPIPGMANFTTDPAADWITASGFGTLSDPVYTHYIEYTVAENTTYEARTTSIGTPYPSWIWSRFIPVGQAGVRRPAVVPTCPTTAITYTRTSWTVGGRYYGSGFTQPWAKMGYGEPGGCRASGLSLSQPGRVRICGYNVADADARGACVAAPRAAAATHSTDPTAGAVTYVTSSGSYTTTATGNTAAAQWVEFLVDEKTPTGGTLSLAVGTSSGGVYLHFGYEHESDLSYGDSDYERWNVGTPTWTFSPAASTTSGSAVTHPTLTEHGRYPGVFLVTCAASNGRPTGSDTNADTDDGFSVRVSAAQGSPSVTYTASAAHPTYPRICKP